MPDNPHKALAQSAKADKLAAEFKKYNMHPDKVSIMTDAEWDEVAKFVGFSRNRETGLHISPETRELTLKRMRGQA